MEIIDKILNRITDPVMKKTIKNYPRPLVKEYSNENMVDFGLKLEYMNNLGLTKSNDRINDEQYNILMETISIIEEEYGLKSNEQLIIESQMRVNKLMEEQFEKTKESVKDMSESIHTVSDSVKNLRDHLHNINNN